MSLLHVTARVVLTLLLTSTAFAQTTVRTEQELTLSIEVPAVPSAQCEAGAATSYHQRNTVARVETTITNATCAAAAGEFKIAVRIRDASGELKTVEFDETWQRSDAKDVVVAKDYPIGENVELVNARIRGLSCTCAEPPPAQGSAASEKPL